MGFWTRLTGTLRSREVESRLDSELELHLDLLAERYMAEDGLSEAQARLKARRQVGNVTQLREQGRDEDVLISLENATRDFRQSARGLKKRPAFAITTIGLLAIGIGSVAALFSVADAIIWKPVAWVNPEQLVSVDESKNGRQNGSNGPRLLDWQKAESFSSATGYYRESMVWKGPNGGESVLAMRGYTGMMATAQPAIEMGRGFTTEEETKGAEVALVTDAFWRSRLNADPEILHRPLELNGKQYAVTGVLAASVGFPDLVGLWMPGPYDLQHGSRTAGYLQVIGRLKVGVSRQQAQAEVATIAGRLREQYKNSDAGLGVSLSSFADAISKDARTPVLFVFAIALSVLLMICVNIAALLLSRAVEREQECSMRAALGASAFSLVRLYLIEALILSFAGGALGMIVATIGLDFLKTALPGGTPRLMDAAMDWRVLAVGFGASCVSALIAGFVPAWLAARRATLQSSARGAVASSRQGLRAVLAVVEIGLSVLLVSTAVRLGESFLAMAQRPMAFRTAEVVAIDVPMPWSSDENKLHGFIKQLLPRLQTLPGVTSAGFIDQLPLQGGSQTNDFQIFGVTDATPVRGGFRSASSGYFATMSIPLLKGRMFEDRNLRELVVNQMFARRYLGGEGDAVGKRISPNKGKSFYDVVGVVADVPQDTIHEKAEPEIYTYYENSFWAPLHFVVRTNAPPALLMPLIRDEVAQLNPSVLVKSVAAMSAEVGEASRESRVRSQIIGGFAFLALVLMAIGLHGLIAGDIATRWREFGVRLALGASNGTIRGQVLLKTGLLLSAGCVLGAVAILASSKVLEATIEGMAPARVTTAAAVMIAVLLAAGSAILWPLVRLARIDPATALRHE